MKLEWSIKDFEAIREVKLTIDQIDMMNFVDLRYSNPAVKAFFDIVNNKKDNEYKISEMLFILGGMAKVIEEMQKQNKKEQEFLKGENNG